MKVLLTGANGTIGFEILNQLIEKEVTEVAILLRSQPSKKLSRLLKTHSFIKILQGDLTDEQSLQSISTAYDCVMHLAGMIVPEAYENEKRTHKVNVEGTKNLLRRLEEVSPNAHFLFSSSVTVYGDRLLNPDIQVEDELRTHSKDFYGWSKIEAEKIVSSSSLKTTIYRLSAIMGADNHKVSKVMFHVPLATQMEICTPKDTARAFVHSLGQLNQLENKIFNLGGGKECRITYRKLLEQSFRIFGLGKLDFPEKTFAEKNFHCGNYVDGDELEEILSFRKDTIQSYFEAVKSSVPWWQKAPTIVLRKPIKFFLTRQSEPLKAWRKKSKEYERFFNE